MRCRVAVIMLAVLLAGPAAQAQLKVGDPAPPLSVTEWLKGQPQSLTAGKGSKIFVLEFWATWCMPCIQQIPHISELQLKFADRGVVVIAVTSPGDRKQRLSEVKQFLKQRGAAMEYTVAWDETDAMSRSYMDAARALGIPYTFIIDKAGKIAWHGFSSPELERILAEMTSGTFDVAKEAARIQNDARIKKLLPRYQAKGLSGDWEGALRILDKIIEIDPARMNPVREVYYLYTQRIENRARLRIWLESFLERFGDNAPALVNLAAVLLSIDEPVERIPDLMLRAARTAHEVADGKDADALAIYAQAAHRVGRIDQAVRLQKQAVQVAGDSKKTEITRVLEYYQACQQLGETQF